MPEIAASTVAPSGGPQPAFPSSKGRGGLGEACVVSCLDVASQCSALLVITFDPSFSVGRLVTMIDDLLIRALCIVHSSAFCAAEVF